MLVATPGGHLLELLALSEAWRGLSRVWVTADRPHSRFALEGERVYFVPPQRPRRFRNVVRNLFRARQLLTTVRPCALVTTGAALAVPFCWAARLTGVPVVYVESATRVNERSLTGRLVAPVADRVYVQWPDLLRAYRRARYVGNVLDSRS
jgi:beta-1,4-N-acetylglucosaminyltransferase